LTYDDVARRISALVKRPITHVRLTFEELTARRQQRGLAELHAQTLALMDLAIADGAEDRTTDDLAELTGRTPHTFDQFVVGERNRVVTRQSLGHSQRDLSFPRLNGRVGCDG
jgi:hypothetical protein